MLLVSVALTRNIRVLEAANRFLELFMLNTSVSPWPVFDEEEIDAVSQVLRSGRVNYWTGDETRQFEHAFAQFADCDHAIAVANGTLALDLALKAVGVGPGDDVIVTPRTFIASVSSVVAAGARPVFADVDRRSGNISPDTISAVLTDRTRAIIPVHLAGWPCDMPEILKLAEPRSISVIEDCAQAHGGRINGRSVGSFGAVGAWSFCQDKIMSTGGEGGMATCNDQDLRLRMWSYKDHGKDWDAVYKREHPPGFRWLHESFGSNWRMLEIQAVIGNIQLRRMTQWHNRRAAIAQRYVDALKAFPSALRVPLPDAEFTHAWYRFYAYTQPDGLRAGWNRDRIVEEVRRSNIPLFQGSCSEVYREKAFDGTGLRPKEPLAAAVELGETSLMFVTHPTLTDEDVDKIIETFSTVMKKASA